MLKVQDCPDGLWDELAHLDPTATCFQTRPWYSLVAPFTRGTAAPLLFEARGVRAVLPLLRRRNPLWESFQSPFGTYTALLSASALPPGFLADIGDWLGRRNVELFSSPFTPNVTPFGMRTPNASYFVDLKALPPGDFASAWAGSQRRYLRKAQEAGFTVRRAAARKDVDAYLGIYAKSYARWDKRARGRYPDALFHALWEAWKDGDALRFWITEVGSEIVGGAVCLYHNGHAAQWHSVVDPERFGAGANQIQLRHAIADAAARGMERYDMNPSGGLEKVEAFKRDFGTVRAAFENYAGVTPVAALARRIKGLLGRTP